MKPDRSSANLLFKLSAASVLSLGLAACQTSGGPDSNAAARLQAAGYQQAPTGAGSTDGSISQVARYVCPAERCGSRSEVVFFVRPGADGANTEQSIRDGTLTDASVRKSFFEGYRETNGRDLSLFRRVGSERGIAYLIAGTGKGRLDGRTWFLRGRLTFVGQASFGVGSYSATDRQAQIGLSAATSD
jgi:hypothetical protein